jgi:hypothetical protein
VRSGVVFGKESTWIEGIENELLRVVDLSSEPASLGAAQPA